jgi:thiol-disulfide isomerase/thioredoxin
MRAAAVIAAFVICFSFVACAQTKRPAAGPKTRTERESIAKPPSKSATTQYAIKVTLVDEAGLKKAMTPNGKPLLVNFWATWCDPCREEFPELVKLNEEYKGKIDFITVSLDDVENITTTVPKFLTAMKAPMPPYLLKASDENTFIASIAKDWQGGMPFTALYSPSGELSYYREGKVIFPTLHQALDKMTAGPTASN